MSEPIMVTWAEYYQFLKDYDNGLFPHQRMGQAFMNKYGINQDRRLFYLTQRGKVMEHIQTKYIKA